ncbi:DTW domain-containing protein [Vibrio sp. ZSDZ34]|jgi:DTW domain-containing protein YfiP|uniref:tRNA-uridine aminocarboxypropyltransferase n=1 Tax=Vibrio gelatinilyticus TaxID=2893468 RepID=A0A9X1WDS3_9VIBR|nr:tRNA-uridine aminocarboxypropyltransferase [Vibrio gelatinilyticus]MCJ2378738.1 DTW domain-containing protein [Vibrio gelatinilyticus]
MKTEMACRKCGFQYNCYCDAIPSITSQLNFTLLTHPNERSRATNTGAILTRLLSNVDVELWARQIPSEKLVTLPSPQQAVVLYPSDNSTEISTLCDQDVSQAHIIVLDATWQEAKKMLLRSPWLNALPKVHVAASQTSQYQLRRNQQAGNLCTFEVVSEVIAVLESQQTALRMQEFFAHYLANFQAERSGHQR